MSFFITVEQPAKDPKKYSEWLRDFKVIAVAEQYFTEQTIDSIDSNYYYNYYQSGLTPEEALWQDLLATEV